MSPHQEHPEFNRPPPDTVIWRFMDIGKFLDLIIKQKLWFSQIRELALHFDAHEGKYTKETIQIMEVEELTYIQSRAPLLGPIRENVVVVPPHKTLAQVKKINCIRTLPMQTVGI